MNSNKPFIPAFLLVAITLVLTSSDFIRTDSNEGIAFFDGSWNEAVQKSKAENKPIFLDVYATWCGPCKMLKRNTFSNKEVGEFFNEHYINVSLNGETTEGRALMQKYNLHAYPSLLIVDSEENVRLNDAGYKTPEKLIAFGKTGLKKSTN